MNNDWYEVWANEGHSVPYLLLLRQFGQIYEVLDPAESNKKVFESRDYETAKMWLLEDEFVLVGRKEVDA